MALRSQLLLTSLAAVALLAPKPAAAKKVVFGDTDVYKALVAVQQAACSDLDAVHARMAEPQEGEPGWIADALALEGGKFADEALQKQLEGMGLREACTKSEGSLAGVANKEIKKKTWETVNWAYPAMSAMVAFWDLDTARMLRAFDPEGLTMGAARAQARMARALGATPAAASSGQFQFESPTEAAKATTRPVRNAKAILSSRRPQLDDFAEFLDVMARAATQHAAATRIQRNLDAHMRAALGNLPPIPSDLEWKQFAALQMTAAERLEQLSRDVYAAREGMAFGAEMTVRHYILRDYFGPVCELRGSEDWPAPETPGFGDLYGASASIYQPLLTGSMRWTGGLDAVQWNKAKSVIEGRNGKRIKAISKNLGWALGAAAASQGRSDVITSITAENAWLEDSQSIGHRLQPYSILQWERKIKTPYCEADVVAKTYMDAHQAIADERAELQRRIDEQLKQRQAREDNRAYAAFVKAGMFCKVPSLVNPDKKFPDTFERRVYDDFGLLSALESSLKACNLVDDSWKEGAQALAVTEELKQHLADFLDQHEAIRAHVEAAIPEATRVATLCRNAAKGTALDKAQILTWKKCMTNADLSSTARRYHVTDYDLYDDFMQKKAVACAKSIPAIQRRTRFQATCPYEDADSEQWNPDDTYNSDSDDVSSVYKWRSGGGEADLEYLP